MCVSIKKKNKKIEALKLEKDEETEKTTVETEKQGGSIEKVVDEHLMTEISAFFCLSSKPETIFQYFERIYSQETYAKVKEAKNHIVIGSGNSPYVKLVIKRSKVLLIVLNWKVKT